MYYSLSHISDHSELNTLLARNSELPTEALGLSVHIASGWHGVQIIAKQEC
jgi:hypothetical protein